MPIDFRRGAVTFDPTQGQIQTQTTTVAFDSQVRRAEAALMAFDIQFTDEDHHIFRELISASVSGGPGPNLVVVTVEFLLRDSSGSIDDRFNGRVDVLVIADVA